jgi:hypothetical protein
MIRHLLLGLGLGASLIFVSSPRAADEVPAGYVALFNGKDLTGWKAHAGKVEGWGVDNGVLYTTGTGGGWLMTEAEFADFEFRVDYKLPKMGNSGAAIRSPMQGDPAYTGMEIQMLDDPNWKGLRPTQYNGSIYDVIAASKSTVKAAGEWNTMKIVAKGRKITIDVNGTEIVNTDLDEHKDKEKKHPGLTRDKGHLGLQSHGTRVEYKNILVKKL